jgi:hypothetical protein
VPATLPAHPHWSIRRRPELLLVVSPHVVFRDVVWADHRWRHLAPPVVVKALVVTTLEAVGPPDGARHRHGVGDATSVGELADVLLCLLGDQRVDAFDPHGRGGLGFDGVADHEDHPGLLVWLVWLAVAFQHPQHVLRRVVVGHNALDALDPQLVALPVKEVHELDGRYGIAPKLHSGGIAPFKSVSYADMAQLELVGIDRLRAHD